MKRILLITLSLFTYILTAQNITHRDNTTPLIIGDQTTFKSTILNENRVLNIYLPAGYSDSTSKSYPVIYLLDGSINEDFLHISGLVQYGSFPWINMLPESIVVGISNVDRRKDFTFPSKNERDKKEFPTAGHSDSFIYFIEKELQPFIEDQYRTASNKTIIGQSLGGLLATEILFKKPELFDNYIIISPSLWWDNKSLLKDEPTSYSSEKAIYIGVGLEGYGMEVMAKELYDKLRPLNKNSTEIYFNLFEDLKHGDVLHLAVYDAFKHIFKKEK